MHRHPDPDAPSRLAELPLGEKLEFLRRPVAYPEPTRRVETIEPYSNSLKVGAGAHNRLYLLVAASGLAYV
jgi:hypothetical protein